MGRPQCLASLRFDKALVIPLKRADGLVPCETASDGRCGHADLDKGGELWGNVARGPDLIARLAA